MARYLAAAAVIVLISALPFMMALSGPLKSFSNPNVSCGSALIDGGYVEDGGEGPIQTDGGYLVTQIAAGSLADLYLFNGGATPIYLGGPTVQPGTHVLAICDEADAGTCYDKKVQIPAQSGALYCTATTATVPRVLGGGF